MYAGHIKGRSCRLLDYGKAVSGCVFDDMHCDLPQVVV